MGFHSARVVVAKQVIWFFVECIFLFTHPLCMVESEPSAMYSLRVIGVRAEATFQFPEMPGFYAINTADLTEEEEAVQVLEAPCICDFNDEGQPSCFVLEWKSFNANLYC